MTEIFSNLLFHMLLDFIQAFIPTANEPGDQLSDFADKDEITKEQVLANQAELRQQIRDLMQQETGTASPVLPPETVRALLLQVTELSFEQTRLGTPRANPNLEKF